MTIRLVVVDDHPIVRDGLAGIFALEEDITVVGQAGIGPEALAVVAERDPDLVLMDLRMPGGDGFAAIRQLRERGGRPRVLVLTTYDTDRDIRRAMAAGADGYLLKDLPRDQLVAAVRELMNGSSTSTSQIGKTHGSQLALTDRETEVLALVADGLTNRAVARRLGISEATVKTHLVHTYAKLGVVDRAAAVREAWERGLV
jgi:two component transcriptional regulator, luxR family